MQACRSWYAGKQRFSGFEAVAGRFKGKQTGAGSQRLVGGQVEADRWTSRGWQTEAGSQEDAGRQGQEACTVRKAGR
jgi:hypothetical protein